MYTNSTRIMFWLKSPPLGEVGNDKTRSLACHLSAAQDFQVESVWLKPQASYFFLNRANVVKKIGKGKINIESGHLSQICMEHI